MARHHHLAAVALIAATALAEAAAAAPASAPTPDGAKVYEACMACHLPSRDGVPARYPPLKGNIAALGASNSGRDYLSAAMTVGIAGVLRVEHKNYAGHMPAMLGYLSWEQIAAVLNYLLAASRAPTSVQRFTPAELQARAAQFKDRLPDAVARQRPH